MYIEKYWGNYIGGTDDSLTLLQYLMETRQNEISLHKIFADTGLDQLNWDFRKTDPVLGFKNKGSMGVSSTMRLILLPIWPL